MQQPVNEGCTVINTVIPYNDVSHLDADHDLILGPLRRSSASRVRRLLYDAVTRVNPIGLVVLLILFAGCATDPAPSIHNPSAVPQAQPDDDNMVDAEERPRIESSQAEETPTSGLGFGEFPSLRTPKPAPLPTEKATTPGRKRGYFTYDDGSTYEGEFQDDKVDGLGTYSWSDGTMYEGVFESALPHGEGRLTWPSGAMYEGPFQAGEMSGTGMMTWPSGATYEGNFTADRIRGYGTLTWPDGLTYSGDFVNEIIQGLGVVKWPDGTIYEGDVVRGSIEGSGTMKWSSGDMYEGGFMDGEPHGEGVYTWASGSRFVGAYENGLAVGGLFYATDNDGREWLFFASQDHNGTWIMEHPWRQLDHSESME